MSGYQQPVPAPRQSGESAGPRRHRRIGPDVRHEIATIMLLTRAVTDAVDVGPESQARLDQLLSPGGARP